MEQVFSYIISLGASVMMPILFTIIGLCIGMKFGKSLKSGLYVGVGFVGLGIVTALLTTNFGGPLSDISELYGLQLGVFDMGWPAAAAVAYNTAVGALIIPICLGVNFLLLVTKCTRTVNIDLWNYWHFAFIGAVAYFVMDQSLAWGYFAAIVCYINTLVMADLTADRFQGYYEGMEGISIPQPFCQSFTPFALVISKALDMIPGFSKLDIDAEGLKKRFGVLGEPLVLGVIVGALIGLLAQLDVKKVLFLGVTMGAVMELIPRITRLFIDGLMPISEKTQEVVKRKFNGKKVYIGMSPALVIGHPTTLVVSLLLLARRHVLRLRHGAALHQGQCRQDVHHRTHCTGRRTVVRHRHGARLHPGCQDGVRADGRQGRRHSRRLRRRSPRLRLLPLRLGHLQVRGLSEVDWRRCAHPRHRRHGRLEPQTYCCRGLQPQRDN